MQKIHGRNIYMLKSNDNGTMCRTEIFEKYAQILIKFSLKLFK